ncbi:preprotein translocase subunit SecA, partial [Streptomyces massasporeus]
FTAMMEGIKEESVGYLFNLEVQVEQQVEEVPVQASGPSLDKEDAVPAGAGRPEIRAKGLDAPQRPDRLHFSAPTVDGDGGVVEGDFASDDVDAGDGMTRAERRKAQKNAGGGGRRRKK